MLKTQYVCCIVLYKIKNKTHQDVTCGHVSRLNSLPFIKYFKILG